MVETTLRVRYAETDAQAIVHHSSYIVWFEVGRSELLRRQGTSYRAIEDSGFITVISDLQARYHASARYDDLVVVRTTLADLRSRQFTFDYEIVMSETGARLVTGRSTHLVLERATGRPTRLPSELLALLR